MNAYTFIILIPLLLVFSLNVAADMLNLRAMRREIPESFREVYDEKRYAESLAYLRVNTRFGWAASGYGLLLLLVFWFGGGFPFLDAWLRSFEFGEILRGVLFIVALMILKTIATLPLDVYSTFIIEQRFGFNRTTPKTYILDLIKGLILLLILGVPILWIILAFFQYAGAMAWVYCWIVATVYMLFVQFIAPTWIMPLFNKFEPIEDDELKTAIMDYARSIAFPLKNIYQMDGSKRSEKSNAFFTGFGKNKRIVLFDTLINRHTVSELVAVLAHEMGHFKKKHIRTHLILGIVHTGLLFFLLSLFITSKGLFDAFFVKDVSLYAGMVFFGLLYTPMETIIGVALQWMSRKHEYEADRFAAETIDDPAALTTALKKLSANNLSNLHPHPFHVFLNHSHPPILERIQAVDRLSAFSKRDVAAS